MVGDGVEVRLSTDDACHALVVGDYPGAMQEDGNVAAAMVGLLRDGLIHAVRGSDGALTFVVADPANGADTLPVGDGKCGR
jgi:hypothetical protein